MLFVVAASGLELVTYELRVLLALVGSLSFLPLVADDLEVHGSRTETVSAEDLDRFQNCRTRRLRFESAVLKRCVVRMTRTRINSLR